MDRWIYRQANTQIDKWMKKYIDSNSDRERERQKKGSDR